MEWAGRHKIQSPLIKMQITKRHSSVVSASLSIITSSNTYLYNITKIHWVFMPVICISNPKSNLTKHSQIIIQHALLYNEDLYTSHSAICPHE
jgi:hypothetical protein